MHQRAFGFYHATLIGVGSNLIEVEFCPTEGSDVLLQFSRLLSLLDTRRHQEKRHPGNIVGGVFCLHPRNVAKADGPF